MKIKEGFVLREVGDETVVVATGELSKTFHGMVELNATGRDIWKGLAAGQTEEEIAGALAAKYDVPVETAAADTKALIARMDEAGFLVK